MKTLKYLSIVGGMLLLASQLFAQIEDRSIEIVHVERSQKTEMPQSFYVNVSVDHENFLYIEDDLMKVSVTSSGSGYLYLLDKDAAGQTILLFPNFMHKDNYIEAHQKLEIPNKNMDFIMRTRSPFGQETIQAIVTLQPIPLESFHDFSVEEREMRAKVLNQTELNDLEDYLARAIGSVGRDRKKPIENDAAEHSIKITTYPKGQAPKTRKKRIFIGICVAKCADKEIEPLPVCEKNLFEMGHFFGQSPVINTYDSMMYTNQQATKEKIVELFSKYLPNHTNPGDEVIVYWTGHGGRCADTSGDEDDGFDETLILYDSQHDDPKTQLIDDDFGRLVQNLSGRKVLFIFDTCYSGGMANQPRGLKDPDNLEVFPWDFGCSECARVRDIGQSDLAMIASCAGDQVSLVRKEEDMSVMTWYVVEHLKSDSQISHNQLGKRIIPQVADYVDQEYNIKQVVVQQDDLNEPMILNP